MRQKRDRGQGAVDLCLRLVVLGWGAAIETVATAHINKKKNAFDGVRSGKSKKLWSKMPKHPANAPTAASRLNRFTNWQFLTFS